MSGARIPRVLQAVPFFLLAGALMDKGGISRRLINFANAWSDGSRRLAMVSVVASMFFAGISGSAAADSAAVGSVMIPAMERKGYAKDFAAALIACAGTIGTMIPPSIPMIIYGVTTGTSIGGLFIAGVVPGVLMGLALMAHAYAVSRQRGYRGLALPSAREAWVAFREALLTLLMPVIVVGASGRDLHLTEAAAIAVFSLSSAGSCTENSAGPRRILLQTGLSTASDVPHRNLHRTDGSSPGRAFRSRHNTFTGMTTDLGISPARQSPPARGRNGDGDSAAIIILRLRCSRWSRNSAIRSFSASSWSSTCPWDWLAPVGPHSSLGNANGRWIVCRAVWPLFFPMIAILLLITLSRRS
jgi:TRAP-type uncharacterized transport system fused permease subunit